MRPTQTSCIIVSEITQNYDTCVLFDSSQYVLFNDLCFFHSQIHAFRFPICTWKGISNMSATASLVGDIRSPGVFPIKITTWKLIRSSDSNSIQNMILIWIHRMILIHQSTFSIEKRIVILIETVQGFGLARTDPSLCRKCLQAVLRKSRGNKGK